MSSNGDAIVIFNYNPTYMNHLNKQIEVDHSALEQYIAEQDRKDQVRNKLDLLGLGLMILCGLIGLFYCFSNANSTFKKNSKEQTGLLEKGDYQYAIAGFSKAKMTPSSSAETSRAFVNIEGKYEAGIPLYFQLDDFNEKVSYEFHLGNGDHKEIHQNQLAYTYPTPGTYEVTLLVTYQGETEKAYSDIITIQ